MKPLHILHLEDEKTDAFKIVNLLSSEYQLTVTDQIDKAKSTWKEDPFDLAILDIDINGKPDGIDFAQYLDTLAPHVPIIFLTHFQGIAIFDEMKLTKPFSYLLKTVTEKELQDTIDKALEKQFDQKRAFRKETEAGIITSETLFVKKGNSIFKLELSDISYVEVEENYSSLHISDNQKYIVNQSLTKIKKCFASQGFVQVHRKSLVNIAHIREIKLNENTIYLKSDQLVPISERYKKQFTDTFNILK